MGQTYLETWRRWGLFRWTSSCWGPEFPQPDSWNWSGWTDHQTGSSAPARPRSSELCGGGERSKVFLRWFQREAKPDRYWWETQRWRLTRLTETQLKMIMFEGDSCETDSNMWVSFKFQFNTELSVLPANFVAESSLSGRKFQHSDHMLADCYRRNGTRPPRNWGQPVGSGDHAELFCCWRSTVSSCSISWLPRGWAWSALQSPSELLVEGGLCPNCCGLSDRLVKLCK